MELIPHIVEILIYISALFAVVLIISYLKNKLFPKNTPKTKPNVQKPLEHKKIKDYSEKSKIIRKTRVVSRNTREMRKTRDEIRKEIRKRLTKTISGESSGTDYDILNEIKKKRKIGRFEVINTKSNQKGIHFK